MSRRKTYRTTSTEILSEYFNGFLLSNQEERRKERESLLKKMEEDSEKRRHAQQVGDSFQVYLNSHYRVKKLEFLQQKMVSVFVTNLL
jgi:hypothetical protein